MKWTVRHVVTKVVSVSALVYSDSLRPAALHHRLFSNHHFACTHTCGVLTILSLLPMFSSCPVAKHVIPI